MPDRERPLVSIIVPSFNQGTYIRETLESILGQRYRPLEVVVMDGGSNDNTLAVLESFRDIPELRWWSEPDHGVVDAVNKGLNIAKGDIIGIQSSDDCYLENAIYDVVAAFAGNTNAGLVFGDVELINAKSELIGKNRQGEFLLPEYLGRLSYIPQPSAFFRRSVLEKVDGWREEFSYVADADFWIRIALLYPVFKINRTLARYRHHDQQRDRHQERIARDWRLMIDDLLVTMALSHELRRSARMGVHLANYRYASKDRWFYRSLEFYKAALVNPYVITDPRFPKRELLPGRQLIQKSLSRFKRSLGFRSRY